MDRTHTGAEIIARSLAAHDVRALFAVQSEQDLARALAHTPEIRTVVLRDEAAAVAAADGYTRVCARPGVVMTGHGASACNALGGMQEAWGASSPVLVLTTQVPSQFLLVQRGAIGEHRDLAAPFESCTRSAHTVDNPYTLSRSVHEAWLELYRGRPRPVMRAFPVDFVRSAADIEIIADAVEHDRPAASDVAVERSIEALRWAQRPVVVAGAGVVQAQAGEPLLRLAEMIHAPILTSIGGKGVVSDEHPLAHGTLHSGALAQATLAGADVVLAVGLRFTALDTDEWAIRPGADSTLIHVDLDNTAFDKNYEAHIPICADAFVAAEQLLNGMANTSMRGRRPTIASLHRARRTSDADVRKNGEDGLAYVDAIRRASHPSTIVVCDRTPLTDWMARHFPVFEPRTFLYPTGGHVSGFALPAAIGAQVASPDSPVLIVTDTDGVFRTLGIWEAVSRIDATVICIAEIDPKEPNLDLTRIANGLGIASNKVDTPRRLRSALQRAYSTGESTIIELRDTVPPPPKLSPAHLS